MSREIIDQIASILHGPAGRTEKAAHIAELIRQTRNYRWVGVYDVGQEMVSIIAYSGPGAPAYPQFPVGRGLPARPFARRRPF